MKKHTFIYKTLSFFISLVMFPLFAPLAHGQELQEIVVTAQKRDQQIQDVPVAVTLLSGDQLTEQSISDVFDLQYSAPSLVVYKSQTTTSSTFAIRGVGTSSQNFGLESSVGLYVDGVYRARQSAMINELVDVKSVEVLRGPQGALFGRNTPSGAVLINTEEPGNISSGYIEVNSGNYDLFSVNGAYGASLIDDILAFRVTGFNTQRDGYVDDLYLGANTNYDKNRSGARLQFLYTPNADLSVKVAADYSEVDEICCAALTYKNNFVSTTGEMGTDVIFSAPETQFVIPGLVTGFGGTIIDESRLDHYEVAYNQLPISKNQDEGVLVELNYDIDAGTLTSISAWRNFDSSDDFDADFSNVEMFRRADVAAQDSFSQELRFTNNGDDFNYIVGAYYFSQELFSVGQTIAGSDFNHLMAVKAFQSAQALADDAMIAAANGDTDSATALQAQASFTQAVATSIAVNVGFPTNSSARNEMLQEHQAWAVFGQMDLAISDQLRLAAGLRYTDEDKKLEGEFTEPGASFGVALGLEELTVINPRPDINTGLRDENLTGTVKLSWLVSHRNMFYGSFGTGYKSGGTNTDRIDPQFDSVFDAETSRAFELGLKSDFPAQNLRLNIAVHDTKTSDFQSNLFNGTGFNLQNAGAMQARGIEVEGWWYPSDDLTVTASFVHNNAKIEEFVNGNCWVATPFHTGIPDSGKGAVDAGFCDRSGDPIPANPENTLQLSVKQNFRVSSQFDGYVRADYSYRSATMMGGNSDPFFRQDGFGLLNLSATLAWQRRNVSLTAWLRNATDEKHYGPVFDMPLLTGKVGAYPGEPRTLGLKLRAEF